MATTPPGQHGVSDLDELLPLATNMPYRVGRTCGHFAGVDYFVQRRQRGRKKAAAVAMEAVKREHCC